MKCLVTGGCGFIGSHLVDRLVADRYEVTVWDDMSNATVERHPATDLVRKDVCDCILDKDYDVIFHLAAVSRTPWAIEDPARCFRSNTESTARLLEQMRWTGCKARFIFGSSCVVYGVENPYKASKLAAEEYVKAYRHIYPISAIILRFSNVYGTRMRWDDVGCMPSLRRSAILNHQLEITGDGEQTRDWTHVSDIVEGLMLAAKESDWIRDPIDLCTGVRTSLNELGKYFNTYVKHVPDRLGDSRHLWQYPERAQHTLGWSAKIKLEDGIKDVLCDNRAKAKAEGEA